MLKNKPVYFLLVGTTSLKSNLKGLRNDSHELILLIHEPKVRLLSEAQRAVFSEVRPVVRFDFDGLVAEVLAMLGSDNGHREVRFVTNDESSLCLAGSLRERFLTDEPTFAMMNRFKDKEVMKETLLASGLQIRVPAFVRFDPALLKHDPEGYKVHIESKLGYPIFAKPVDSASSNGTRLIRDRKELLEWTRENDDKINFELDEYLLGVLFHCDSLVSDGQIRFVKVSRYNVPCAEFLSGKPLGSITLVDSSVDAQAVMRFNERVLSAFRPLPNGAFHLEVFRTKGGELVFLEVAARAPGAYVPQGISKAMDLNIEESHFKLQMGIATEQDWGPAKEGFAAWMWYPIRSGIVTALVFPDIASSHEIDWKVKIGSNLGNPMELPDFAVGVRLWNEDFAQLNRDFELLGKHSPLVMKGERGELRD